MSKCPRHSCRTLTRPAGLMLAGFSLGFSAHAAPLQLSAVLGTQWDGNLNNAARSEDARRSAVLDLQAQVSQSYRLTALQDARIQLGVEAQLPTRFEGLNQQRLPIELRYRRQLGSGYFAPLLTLSASVAAIRSRDDGRDGSEQGLGSSLRLPLTTRLNALAAFDYRHRVAGARAFAGEQRLTTLALDYRITPALLTFGSGAWQQGWFTTSLGAAAPAPVTARNATVDAAYGGDGKAFRQGGEGAVLAAGLNLVLTPQWSLEVAGRFAELRNAVGVHYQRWQSGASLLWRY